MVEIGKYIRTDEIRKKNSISNMGKNSGTKNYFYGKDKSGKNNPMYGKHHTEESRQRNREKMLNRYDGENNPFYGKHHTEQSKQLISKNESGKIDSIETKLKKSKSKKLEKHPNWQGGISFEPYCYKFNEPTKEKIRNRDGRICQECNKTEQENREKLTVHHIHYDKPNCEPDLISLCRSCNAKANFNRNYWEEHFVNKLRKRGL